MADELVLVVPTVTVVAGLGGGAAWHGLRPAAEVGPATLTDVIARHGAFHPRRAMEDDPAWKQVIPYPVLRDGDAWFLMKRTRAGSDARLHDRYSIGVGGHVNPGDVGSDGDLTRAMAREWHEELAVDFVPDFRFIGLLNDDSTAVGAVHLGAVYVGEAAGRTVAIREADKLSGRFVPAAEVATVADDLETWSRIAYEFLLGDAALR